MMKTLNTLKYFFFYLPTTSKLTTVLELQTDLKKVCLNSEEKQRIKKILNMDNFPIADTK